MDRAYVINVVSFWEIVVASWIAGHSFGPDIGMIVFLISHALMNPIYKKGY